MDKDLSLPFGAFEGAAGEAAMHMVRVRIAQMFEARRAVKAVTGINRAWKAILGLIRMGKGGRRRV